MNRDAKFINFSEEHELDYILKKYGKEPSKENRDLLKEFGKKAKEFCSSDLSSSLAFFPNSFKRSLFSLLGSLPYFFKM